MDKKNINQGRTHRSLQNITIGFFNQIVVFALGLISRTIFINIFGKEYLGLNGLFADVLNMLSMADLGFGIAMSYSFYKPLADRDEDKLAALMNFYKKVYYCIASCVAIIGVILTPFIKYIVNTEKAIPNLEIYYIISLSGVVCSYLFIYKSTIITADQRNYIISITNIITNIIKIILQIIVLTVFSNYILYLLIDLITILLNNIIIARRADKLYPFVNKKSNLSHTDKKEIFTNLKSIVLYKLSGVLLNATDNIFISTLVSTAYVGVYSNYNLIGVKLVSIIQIIFSSLTASIGNIVAKENSKKQYDIFKAIQSINFILCGVVVSVFFTMINDVIWIWLGKEYVLSVPVVMAITLNIYLTGVLQPLFSYREATGIYRKTKYIMLITALLNILLSIVMGRKMGLMGIILASCISRLCTYIWYEPLVLFKTYFNKPVYLYYISLITNCGLTLLVSLGINQALKQFAVKSLLDLIIKGAIVGVAVSVLFIIMYSRSAGIKLIIEKITYFKQKFKR